MSNPTTLTSLFDGSAPGWSLSGPERYNSGLWLEEATTNLLRNPSAEADHTTGVAYSGGVTGSRNTDHHSVGSASFGVVTPATVSTGIVISSATGLGLTGSALPFVGSMDLEGNGSVNVNVVLRYTDTTNTTGSTQLHANGSGYQRVKTPVVTSDPAKTLTSVEIAARNSANAVITFYPDAAQVEQKAYATSYADGSLGAGYGGSAGAWTRAASSASISPTGILNPASGALAFRITPTIETGLEEIWGECGVKGSGTDHVRWGRDASKHPFVEWSANNASYQRLTGSETLNALTTYDLYLGHSATTISLAVDAGTLQTGTRAAVSGDFSTGDLTLEASAGGVIYQPFATFDRPLMNYEVARLNSAGTWTMGTVLARRFDSVQLARFRVSSCMGVR